MSEQFDPRLKQYILERTGLLLEEGAPEPPIAEEEVPVLVRLANPEGGALPWFRVVASFGPVVTGRVPLGRVMELRRHPGVASLKVSRFVSPPTIAAGEAAAAWPTAWRPPVPAGMDGSGVLVASCDWGLDVAHAAFRREDGSTRLRALWDQRGPPGPASPDPYGYGRVLTTPEINEALQAADPYTALGYDPADVDVDGVGTHGTFVLDVAAGSGRAPGSRAGLACKSDLAFVHLAANDIGPGETLGDSVRLAEAVRWLVDLAGADPLVINISAGSTGGPHDRSPLLVQALDALMAERPGVAVVFSCGNYATSRLHASGSVPAGGLAMLPWTVQRHGARPAELEVWYPGSEEITVALLDPGGNQVMTLNAGDGRAVRGTDGLIASGFHRCHDPNNGDNVADLFLWPQAALGTWTVVLAAKSRPVTRVHAYVERVDTAQSRLADTPAGHPGAMAVDPSGTTGTICNGLAPLAVGALDTRVAPVRPAIFSSFGPSRDGLPKPDLAAPGVAIVAARSSPGQSSGPRPADLQTIKSGTSVAAPVVTGCVALMYQAALPSLLSTSDLRAILLGTAQPVAGLPPEQLPRVGAGVPDPLLAWARVGSRVAGVGGGEGAQYTGADLPDMAAMEALMTTPGLLPSPASNLPSEQVRPAYPPGPYWGESGPPTALPILLVPGILGSRLVEPDTLAGVWDPTAFPEALPAFNLIRLSEVDRPLQTAPRPNNIPKLLLSADDIARAQQIDNIGSLIFMSYGRMALALSAPDFSWQTEQALGLPTRVYGAGYDWRQSCRRTAITLEGLVTSALAECRSRQVVLVAHSMGGIVSRWFCKNRTIDGRPGSEYVAALCLLGSPTYGAPKAYRWLKFGVDPAGDSPWDAFLAGPGGSVLAAAMQSLPWASRQLARCFTSIFELLPTQAYCGNNPAWITLDGEPAGGDADSLYSSANLGFDAASSEAMRAQLLARRTVHDSGAERIGDYLPDGALVLAGTQLSTEGGFQLQTSPQPSRLIGDVFALQPSSLISDVFGFPPAQRAMTSGDETVPSYSALATGLSLGSGRRIEVPRVSHADLCNDPRVIAAVQEIVLHRVAVPV